MITSTTPVTGSAGTPPATPARCTCPGRPQVSMTSGLSAVTLRPSTTTAPAHWLANYGSAGLGDGRVVCCKAAGIEHHGAGILAGEFRQQRAGVFVDGGR